MVNEQQTNKTETTGATASNNDDRSNAEGANLVERANIERKRLEEENDRLEKNIKELRDLEASRLLGSTAGGRIEPPVLSEEEAKKKQAMEFWKGTGIDDAIAKYG